MIYVIFFYKKKVYQLLKFQKYLRPVINEFTDIKLKKNEIINN